MVNGTARLAGTLNVALINGYRPAVGDVFTIVEQQSLSGSFSQIQVEGSTVRANYASGAVTITVTSVADALLNISTRARVRAGEQSLIGGFIITGAEPKRVIIRAIGPSLSSRGVAGALADPALQLFDAAGEPMLFNDNWKDSQEKEIEETGLAPSADAEAAIVTTLEPRSYTAVVRGRDNTAGIGLVEVYDLSQRARSKLANISSRGFVGTGENVLIGGLITGGGTESMRVAVRALGPTLRGQGVSDPLRNPALQLRDANGSLLRENDDWKQSQQSEIEALGLQPTDELEAVVLATLPAGSYTAIIRGAGETTGVALAEVYDLN